MSDDGVQGKNEPTKKDSWYVRHDYGLKVGMRIVIGIIWAIDGSLKFLPSSVDAISSKFPDMASGQPSWLQGWFSFWGSILASNPSLTVFSTGIVELLLAACLILGFARKIAYAGGIVLSFFIWSVPEGFGGPYVPGATDIGAAVIYVFVFLFLIINAAYGPSKYSVDYLIGKRLKWWFKISEIRH